LASGGTCLLIGTGNKYNQYVYWPEYVINLGIKSCEYIEVFYDNYLLFKNGKYKVTFGDAKDLLKIYGAKTFDMCLWAQGPEHSTNEDMISIMDQMSQLSKKVCVVACPWGTYYDYQEDIYGNIYEKHLQKNMDVCNFLEPIKNGWIIKTFDKKDTGNGAIVGVKFIK
jgi:hypothetical protein